APRRWFHGNVRADDPLGDQPPDSLDHIPLPIVGDAIDRQCNSVAANIIARRHEATQIERWIRLFGAACGEPLGSRLPKLSRETQRAWRDVRRLAKCAVLDGWGFIRQSERISEPWSCLGHRNSWDPNHNGKRAGR